MLENWLGNGMHGSMQWMERSLPLRKDPRLLVDNASTVISLLLNYYTPEMQEDPSAPVISKYAYGKDYHKVIKKMLKKLLASIREALPGVSGRGFVDSAPVMEHAWAARAGLGWIGKNSLLLNKQLGSWFFISEIIIDRELEPDKPLQDSCGNCRLCIDECPTHAINLNRTVDARKCISYLTIENKEELPVEMKDAFYNRVFGCDICQEVCPWNRNAKPHKVESLKPGNELMKMSRKQWEQLDQEKFNQLFEGSAVKRTGFGGLKRNIGFLSD